MAQPPFKPANNFAFCPVTFNIFNEMLPNANIPYFELTHATSFTGFQAQSPHDTTVSISRWGGRFLRSWYRFAAPKSPRAVRTT
jgi:hypothetical protein